MSDYNTYANYIFDILGPLKRDLQLTEDTDLVAGVGLSSLQVMELIEKIEDRFDISIPLNILPEVNTIKDLACQLEKISKKREIQTDAV